MSSRKVNPYEAEHDGTTKAKEVLREAKKMHKNERSVRVTDKLVICIKPGEDEETAIRNFTKRLESFRRKSDY